MQTLLDPVNCGPVTLAFPQDVQSEAFDFPESLFRKKVHKVRRATAQEDELVLAVKALKSAKKPIIIAGGGVLYSEAACELAQFALKHNIPVAETQAGKGSLSWDHPCAVGGIGVTGSSAANQLAQEADVVLSIGTRLQDFTTESRTLLAHEEKMLIQLNVGTFDAEKHGAQSLVGDARMVIKQLEQALASWTGCKEWVAHAKKLNAQWQNVYAKVTANTASQLPSDAQVLGAVKRNSTTNDVVVCAAGGLPGELHKLWRAEGPGTYHVEYGFSCMGYEIAGGLGVKMASPHREVFVVVGDGSYMMMNSELATSIMLEQKITVVLLDNRGFGCINRLQQGTGNAPFNNLLENCVGNPEAMKIDFAAHAKSMGANAFCVSNIDELECALVKARSSDKTTLISINTDPHISTNNGSWWDVAVPQTSTREEVILAYEHYKRAQRKQPY